MNTPNSPVSRRDLLRRSLLGAAGLSLADNPLIRAWAASPPSQITGKARSVIQIWLWGGPPHLDTFDPKPDAGRDYSGPLTQPIETNVRGMRIGQLLPLLARQADKFSLIRSLTHGSNAHETATYMVQTGRKAGERLVYPCVGSVVSLFKGYDGGYQGQIPPYILLTEPVGRFEEAGFLPTRYKPFITGGDPSQDRFAVEGVVAEGITDQQQRDRQALLGKLDSLGRALPSHAAIKALARSREQAFDLIVGDGGKAFDVSQENEAVRDRYGRTTLPAQAVNQRAPRTRFGQACLVARRLVERGVPYVTINYPGWDTHKDNFTEMNRMLPDLDRGLAALLGDLADRGLLDRTIVWVGGEFGRTPRIDWDAPWNGGRGHWGGAFSALVAGGGFRGGQVVGATDARGEEVKVRPVYPSDLIGTIYKLLGIDPAASLPNPQGLDARVMPAPADGTPASGLLNEIL